jgi:ribose transport system permease protein
MKQFLRCGLLIALLILFIFFSLATPTFFTFTNLKSVALNHVAILALVSLGMTLVVCAGGIDLSIGTAFDMSCLGFIEVLAHGGGALLALTTAFFAALAVGLFNAMMIVGLRVPPFLATLGTLFIGESVQQLVTDGGTPVYLISGPAIPIFRTINTSSLWIVAVSSLLMLLLLAASSFGRRVTVMGISSEVARYSGLAVSRDTVVVMVLAAILAGIAGVVLSSSVQIYAPLSGNAYLMDAIGATFLGTTFNLQGRANVIGTLLGVLLLSIVTNGLILVGLSIYWQQVGSGILIFLVLALSFRAQQGKGSRSSANASELSIFASRCIKALRAKT